MKTDEELADDLINRDNSWVRMHHDAYRGEAMKRVQQTRRAERRVRQRRPTNGQVTLHVAGIMVCQFALYLGWLYGRSKDGSPGPLSNSLWIILWVSLTLLIYGRIKKLAV